MRTLKASGSSSTVVLVVVLIIVACIIATVIAIFLLVRFLERRRKLRRDAVVRAGSTLNEGIHRRRRRFSETEYGDLALSKRPRLFEGDDDWSKAMRSMEGKLEEKVTEHVVEVVDEHLSDVVDARMNEVDEHVQNVVDARLDEAVGQIEEVVRKDIHREMENDQARMSGESHNELDTVALNTTRPMSSDASFTKMKQDVLYRPVSHALSVITDDSVSDKQSLKSSRV